MEQKDKIVLLYTDGSCWNRSAEPALLPATSVSIIIDPENDMVITYQMSMRTHGTSNNGELTALIEGVEMCYRKGFKNIKILTDSNYAIKKLKGELQADINSHLYHKWKAVKSLVDTVEFELVKSHSGNKYNEIADKICRHLRYGITEIINDINDSNYFQK